MTKELDESQRLAYLSCLLKVAKCSRRTPSPFAVGLMTGKEGSLKARFRYVLEHPRTSPLFHAVALLCIVMMALSFLYCWTFLEDETKNLFFRYAEGKFTETERSNSEDISLLYITELVRQFTRHCRQKCRFVV